jgi:hypothetical protein
MNPEKVKALDALFEKLCEELKKITFHPRYVLGTDEEKAKTVKKYVRALECLDVRVPEIDPIIVDIFKSNLVPGRQFFAAASDRPKAK